MAKNDQTLKQWLLSFVQSQDVVCQVPEIMRTQISVLLEKRFRGETLGDRIGRWNYRTNNYVEPVPDLQPFNIYTENIVKPKVRSNAAVMAQASIAVSCEPRTSSTRSKKNAMICQKVSDWADDELWTPELVLQMNVMKQLTHGVFLRSFWNEDKEGCKVKAEDWQEEAFETPATFACLKCGAPDVQMDKCPECGGDMAEHSPADKIMVDTSVEVEKNHPGDNDIELHPSLEYRVDEKNSQGARLDKCRWVQRWHLMPKFEVENQFKPDNLGEPTDWPYQLKWLYTLQSGTAFPFKGYKQTTELMQRLKLYAVRKLYLTPEFLGAYGEATEDQELGDLKLKAGENPRDVVLKMADEGETAAKNRGLCVVIEGKNLLTAYLATFKPGPDEGLEYTYFVSDPYSFWALCYSELETFQHLVNQTLTSIGNQVQSNQHIGVFDRDAYDDDDLSGEKNQIFTRPGNEKPVRETYGVIEALPVTRDTWELYQGMKASAVDTSLVSKEVQGQPSEAKTFAGAQLNRDQAVGVLTPTQQSTATAKTGTMKQQCFIAQAHWPTERLTELCGDDGLITDEDIENWYQSDLNADVVFNYRPGSEMPKSFIERRDDLSYVTNFIAEMGKFVPGLVTAQLGVELINRVADVSSVEDLDIQNADMDKEVAEVRYHIIEEGLESAVQEQLMVPQPPEQIQAQALAKVLQNPFLMPLKQENHDVAMEFYRDKCMYEYRCEQPNLLLVAALQEMIQRHIDAFVAEGQIKLKTMAAVSPPPPPPFPVQMAYKDLQPDVQAQVVQAEGFQPSQMPPQPDPSAQIEGAKLQTQQGQQKAEFMLKAAQLHSQNENEQAKITAEDQRTEADRHAALVHKSLDLANQADQRDHEQEMATRQEAANAGQQSSGGA